MVSVVVIGKDEGVGITSCLQSVLAALTGAVPFEILYVDSHSQDDSLVRARALGARCFLPRERRTTPALGRFIGAREARGEQVLFLDGDMTLEPGFVEAALSALAEGYRGVCGIRRDVYMRGGEICGECGNYFGCRERRVAPEFGGAVLLERAALLEAGSWAPAVETCEEAELYARLKRCGMQVVELPIPMITHTDRVRDARGLLGTIISRRRLGQGQALWHAITRRSARFLLQGDLTTRAWAIEAVALAVALAAGLALGGMKGFSVFALLFTLCQGALLAYLRRRGRGRSLVSALLLLFYMPAGMLTYRRRDESYARWGATT